MAAKELMGWVRSMRRWQKRYRGKFYTVSPRQLGADPKTRTASREAANTWWANKKAKIDDAAVPPVPEAEMEEPRLLSRLPMPKEVEEILQTRADRQTDEQRTILEKWKQEVAERAKPQIRQFSGHRG